MTSAIAAKLIDALEAAAQREAGVQTALVSVTIDMLSAGAEASIEAKLVRKTRTLVFISAEAQAATGERVATASSVHKVLGV